MAKGPNLAAEISYFLCYCLNNCVCLYCVFRYKWTSEWSHLRGLGRTQDHGFPWMTLRNPRAVNDGLKHRIGTHDWMQPILPVQPLLRLPVLRLYNLTSLILKWDRLSGSKVNESRLYCGCFQYLGHFVRELHCSFMFRWINMTVSMYWWCWCSFICDASWTVGGRYIMQLFALKNCSWLACNIVIANTDVHWSDAWIDF